MQLQNDAVVPAGSVQSAAVAASSIAPFQAALMRRLAGITLDPSQAAALLALAQLLSHYPLAKRSWRNAWRAPPQPYGVYLYGHFGSGKSMLMDAFYAELAEPRKWRVHFHDFMQQLHQGLQQHKGAHDPLAIVAQAFAARYRFICFDEFHITDVADAMLLHRLLVQFFALRVNFVMTSNYAPDGLYPKGLQRHYLMPAIALLNTRMRLFPVGRGVDYRQQRLRAAQSYVTPLGPAADAHLAHWFAVAVGVSAEKSQRESIDRSIADANGESQREIHRSIEVDSTRTTALAPPVARELEINGRKLSVIAVQGSVLWVGFDALCRSARGQHDYLQLVARFHTVFLADVPHMQAQDASAARRFTWLIDIFYDQRIRLIISAAGEPQTLYPVGDFAQEFLRTASRLEEMRSAAYLAQLDHSGLR